MIVLGLYCSPLVTGKDYHVRLEEKLNDICSWVSLQKHFIIIMGGLNLNRLRPDQGEGKILHDLEEENGLHCLIRDPTRVTQNSTSPLKL